MKTTRLLGSGILLLLLTACASTKPTFTTAEKAKLDQKFQEKSLYLQAKWANPLATRTVSSLAGSGLLQPGSSPNRIDLMGTTAYLEIEGDSVRAQLPYYGERQFGNTYNPADVGIRFEGVPKNLKLEFNETKQRYDFAFDIVNKRGEGFNINGSCFPNLRTIFYVNSTQRLTIGYNGIVAEKEE